MDKFLPKVLETERLIIRPLTMDDKPEIYKWASDPRVSKYMLYSNYNSEDDADIWLDNLYLKDKELDYGFVWKETGELIGSGGISYSEENGDWSLGYNIRYDMWGKGIVYEACKKIIEYARENYNVNKIVGVFAVDNPNSGKIMEKLGMTFHKDCEYTKFDGSATFKAKNYEIIFE